MSKNEEKLVLLRTGIAHVARLWEEGGHQKWSWIMPRFTRIENEFDALSVEELRQRLRTIYKRLVQEKSLLT